MRKRSSGSCASGKSSDSNKRDLSNVAFHLLAKEVNSRIDALVVRRDGGVQITHSHVHQSTEQPVEQRARQASAPLGSVNGDLPYQHGIGLRGSPISDHKPNYFFVNARHDRRVSEIDTPQQVRV